MPRPYSRSPLGCSRQIGTGVNERGLQPAPCHYRGANSITFLPLRVRTAGEKGFEVSALAIFLLPPPFLPGEPSFQVIQPLPPEPPGRELQRFPRTSIKLLLPS